MCVQAHVCVQKIRVLETCYWHEQINIHNAKAFRSMYILKPTGYVSISCGLAAWNASTTATAGNGRVSVILMMRNVMVL